MSLKLRAMSALLWVSVATCAVVNTITATESELTPEAAKEQELQASTSRLLSSIYGKYPDLDLSPLTQQIIVGVLTILLFVGMAIELLSPEVLFLIAVTIVLICQIITLQDALSGKSSNFYPLEVLVI